jgi:uncharacterized metal-binding protein
MVKSKVCCGAGESKLLVFPCSGVSDTGEISDRAARQMHREGLGKMSCLAGIGGRAKNIMAMAQSASGLLAINGCPLDCASLTLRQAGFPKLLELRVTDLGLPKGKSPVTEKNLAKVFRAAQALVSASPARSAAAAVKECC